jgi:hypothetical protein
VLILALILTKANKYNRDLDYENLMPVDHMYFQVVQSGHVITYFDLH